MLSFRIRSVSPQSGQQSANGRTQRWLRALEQPTVCRCEGAEDRYRSTVADVVAGGGRSRPADPSCNANVLRYSFGDVLGKGILYSGPDSINRQQQRIYLSLDDGATWPIKAHVLRPDGFAYSVLTRLSDRIHRLSVLSRMMPNQILFARIPLAWLESANATANPPRSVFLRPTFANGPLPWCWECHCFARVRCARFLPAQPFVVVAGA